MPRLVDPDERRRHIVEALLRLTGERGLEAVTLREVAQAAGVSMGAVQHYFTSKQEMVVFALQHWLRLSVHEGFTRRVRDRLGPDPASASPAAVLLAVAAEYLPHDEPSRADARVAVAFSAQAAVDPVLAQALAPAYRALAATLDSMLPTLAPGGGTAGQGRLLAALLDGLRTPVLLGVIDYGDALNGVEQYLERMVGDPPDSSGPAPRLDREPAVPGVRGSGQGVG